MARLSATQEGPNRLRSAPITDPLSRGFKEDKGPNKALVKFEPLQKNIVCFQKELIEERTHSFEQASESFSTWLYITHRERKSRMCSRRRVSVGTWSTRGGGHWRSGRQGPCVNLAARVLPTAAGSCPLVGAGFLGPATAAPSHHLPGTRCFIKEQILLKNKFYNLLPIWDRPSTLTSYSICDPQHILTQGGGSQSRVSTC